MGKMIDAMWYYLSAVKKISDLGFYPHLNLILSNSHYKTDTV